MPLPTWALFAIAGWLMLFGIFRIAVSIRGRRRADEGEAPRGILALSWRRHLVFGVFYFVVGAYLLVMALGFGVPRAMQPEEPVPLPSPRSPHLLID
jgi:hypothetical protein